MSAIPFIDSFSEHQGKKGFRTDLHVHLEQQRFLVTLLFKDGGDWDYEQVVNEVFTLKWYPTKYADVFTIKLPYARVFIRELILEAR